jgi:hypothetical protein
LLAAVSAIVAGWGDDDQPAPARSRAQAASSADAVLTTDLSRCPDSRAANAASGWGGSVDGISCGVAGELIIDHFDRDFAASGLSGSDSESIRRSDPGTFRSAGFACASFPLPDGFGWHILCGAPDQEISFYFTP